MNKKHVIISVLLIGLISFIFWIKCDNTKTLYDYYSNSILASEYKYVIVNDDTLLHGKYISYNRKGNKIEEGNYVYGEPKGKYIRYFDNGVIESISYRENSKIKQQSIYNFPSGKIMRYTLYDDEGLSAFIIRFNEEGNVKNYEGYPIMEVYQYRIKEEDRFNKKNDRFFKIGDILEYKYIIAKIPNSKCTLKIENLNLDKTKVKRTYKKIPPVSLDVKEVLTQKGINTIRAIVKYEFNDKEKTAINDTVSFKVLVH